MEKLTERSICTCMWPIMHVDKVQLTLNLINFKVSKFYLKVKFLVNRRKRKKRILIHKQVTHNTYTKILEKKYLTYLIRKQRSLHMEGKGTVRCVHGWEPDTKETKANRPILERFLNQVHTFTWNIMNKILILPQCSRYYYGFVSTIVYTCILPKKFMTTLYWSNWW